MRVHLINIDDGSKKNLKVKRFFLYLFYKVYRLYRFYRK